MQGLQDRSRVLVAQPRIPQVEAGEPAGVEEPGDEDGTLVVDVALPDGQTGQDPVVLQCLTQMLQSHAKRILTPEQIDDLKKRFNLP